MATQIVEANERLYTVAMEEPVPMARRLWAVVQARVVDELTGAPPRSRIRLETPLQGFSPRVAPGGLTGLLAVPETVFPRLDVQGYTVPFSIRADGYLPLEVEVPLPADPLFPVAFEPFRFASDLALHRESTRIVGRVFRRTGGVLTPVAGATVEVAGVWPLLVPAAIEPPPDPADLVSLDPPLYAGRTTATGQLRRREVTPVAGEDKELREPVHAGDTRLEVSDWINLNPGDLLLIDTDPAIQEYGTIDTITPVGAAPLPATLTLTHGLAYGHRTGRRVQRVVPQGPGPARTFARDAITRDTCVFLDSLASLAGVDVVEVSGGGAPPEFHRLSLFTALSDAEGRYRLPPLGRVAKLTLEATEGASSSGTVEFIPDYLRRENLLDLELT